VNASTFRAIALTTLPTVVLVLSFGIASSAPTPADPVEVLVDEPEINGTFTAISDGQWAKTNEVFRDEASVTSTWTITSTCSDPTTCTGRVTSDQGWSAEARYQSRTWTVFHRVENWEPCPDGTAGAGERVFTFFKITPATLIGWDKTIGDSGACGINLSLTVKMPFKLIQNP
jgi:hypothetical protein